MLRDRDRFDLVAHFPSAEKARAAEGTFGGRLEEDTSVTSGFASWVGLGAGLALGVAVGLLFYRNPPAIGFPSAVIAQRGILATALWADILGACGWIIGTTTQLFSSATSTNRFGLRVTVGAEKLAELRRQLIAGGATAVNISEAGTPGRGRESDHLRTADALHKPTT